jgi:hypothetical protein
MTYPQLKNGSSGRSARCIQPMPRRGATNQPRATPWGEGFEGNICPERAVQFSKAASALSARFRTPWIASNQRFAWEFKGMLRPDRACSCARDEFPGRCPGLVCYCPFGARSRCFRDRLVRMDQNP